MLKPLLNLTANCSTEDRATNCCVVVMYLHQGKMKNYLNEYKIHLNDMQVKTIYMVNRNYDINCYQITTFRATIG